MPDTREKVLKCIDLCIESTQEACKKCDFRNEKHCAISMMTEAASIIQSQQKWIPVTERLPEPGKRVLVNVGAAFEAFIDNDGEWQRYYSAPLNEVLGEPTHWMPMPEPPKGDSDE